MVRRIGTISRCRSIAAIDPMVTHLAHATDDPRMPVAFPATTSTEAGLGGGNRATDRAAE